MLYVQRVPAPPLDRFIRCIWYCESEPRPFALERILPQGSPQLIVNLKEDQTRMYHPETGALIATSGAAISGIFTRFCIIDTCEQECVAGVNFHPGGMPPFFSMPAYEFRDADVPLEFAWDRARSVSLRDQLLSAASPAARLDVLERAMADAFRTHTFDGAVGYAVDALAQSSDIAALADTVGLSSKRLAERFKLAVGVSPKIYYRLVRFQRALQCAEGGRAVDWTRIALDCGYYDQAHFIHDFRSFAGITPTGYDSDRTQFRNHVRFLQADSASEMR